MLGKFIVFEGIDGCGKTTQLHRLAQWLPQQLLEKQVVLGQARPHPGAAGPAAGRSPHLLLTKEPGATELGRTLRHLLLTPPAGPDAEPMAPPAELLLYAADRAQHVAQQLRPALAAGAWVLCDRYEDSTWAYQGKGRGLDLDLIEQLNGIATDGLHSDLTLWLDLDPAETGRRLRDRGQADRLEQADAAFHQRVSQGFAQLAQRHPQRIVRIDAQGSEDEVAQRIQQVVLDWMERGLLTPGSHTKVNSD
ncbi:MAG: dTMP kinase [Synechococcales cyanobacterium RM1_1_8]|nr:dTMP kinase [Synechococcales cyanobacterium RM1_1_8]